MKKLLRVVNFNLQAILSSLSLHLFSKLVRVRLPHLPIDPFLILTNDKAKKEIAAILILELHFYITHKLRRSIF